MWATDSLLEAACARFDLMPLPFELASGRLAVRPEALWREVPLRCRWQMGAPQHRGE